MNAFTMLDQTLHLSPEGAVYLPEEGALIVADLHLGKAATFRAKGLPIPEGDNVRDLARLLAIVRKTQARRLIIAGDLFHAPAGITAEVEDDVHGFLDQLAIPFHLVSGNHDAKLKYLPCSITESKACDLGNIRIIHDPKDAATDRLHLAGHWHPVVKIKDGARTSLRLRCFLLRNSTLILPSFGGFTGGAVIPLIEKDRVFVPLREQVTELPATLVR